MAIVYKNHHRTLTTSRLVCEIVFDEEFSNLWDELASLYKKISAANPKQEAFRDAFYSFYTQKEKVQKNLTASNR